MTELTEYNSEELKCVERIIGELHSQALNGQCDTRMRGTIEHLIEEVLFLRAVLTKHPPYSLAHKRS